uniref:Uncharacterized protein n=1 Tax=Arundo donax TaxID=35708 RepID=A0A0A9BGS1_ARUDO
MPVQGTMWPGAMGV